MADLFTDTALGLLANTLDPEVAADLANVLGRNRVVPGIW
jgi:hypothetical protein